jgi:hypothetical protein
MRLACKKQNKLFAAHRFDTAHQIVSTLFAAGFCQLWLIIFYRNGPMMKDTACASIRVRPAAEICKAIGERNAQAATGDVADCDPKNVEKSSLH